MSEIKLKGVKEPINFHNLKSPWIRFMQDLKNPEDVLSDVLSALQTDFSKYVHIAVNFFSSISGDPEQQTYTDFAQEVNSLTNLSEFHYSAIVSLEENTHLLIGPLRVSVDIPLHSMPLFRGDMEHARAAYTVKNTRLFIPASCDKFPVTRDVFLVFSTKRYLFLTR